MVFRLQQNKVANLIFMLFLLGAVAQMCSPVPVTAQSTTSCAVVGAYHEAGNDASPVWIRIQVPPPPSPPSYYRVKYGNYEAYFSTASSVQYGSEYYITVAVPVDQTGYEEDGEGDDIDILGQNLIVSTPNYGGNQRQYCLNAGQSESGQDDNGLGASLLNDPDINREDSTIPTGGSAVAYDSAEVALNPAGNGSGGGGGSGGGSGGGGDPDLSEEEDPASLCPQTAAEEKQACVDALAANAERVACEDQRREGKVYLRAFVTEGQCVTLVEFVGLLKNYILIFASVAAGGMFVYGAFKYQTSRGNPAALSDARSIITNSIVGLLLIACAIVILQVLNGVFGFAGGGINLLGPFSAL